MNTDLLNLVDEELFLDNIDTEIDDNRIFWMDNLGAENEVLVNQIATNGSQLAWWQKNEVGKELLRIKIKDGLIMNWRPPINTMGLASAGCSFIEFKDHLLTVTYRDKHKDRTFNIDTQTLVIIELKRN